MTSSTLSRRSTPAKRGQKKCAPEFRGRARKAWDKAASSLADGDVERGEMGIALIAVTSAFSLFLSLCELGII